MFWSEPANDLRPPLDGLLSCERQALMSHVLRHLFRLDDLEMVKRVLKAKQKISRLFMF